MASYQFIVGVFITVIGIFFFVRRSQRLRREGNVGSSPLSSPVHRRSLSQARGSGGWFADVEQIRLPNPFHSHLSVTPSSTIDTGEIFPATSSPMVAPSPGLRNNPVNGMVIQKSGYVKTIIKPMPFQNAKEVIISPKKQTPNAQQTDIYIQEKAGEIFPGEWPETLYKKPLPLVFDLLGRDEGGKAEKKKTLLLDHKPGERWSDPFNLTVPWRGSGEVSEGGTSWKSALSCVKDKNGRLDIPEKSKVTGRKSGVSL